ncbi:MAG: hypothetical protein DI603_06065 [Roseateles depolymerans]|uniref:RHS repeat protein n=1 Tax=Roseateles depolymerans TaxID=76731 RepID=A0A2W5DRE4_9BURK|nr:MAG: hypothetical protein DI603_06065 [Roseateles depolymerans]
MPALTNPIPTPSATGRRLQGVALSLASGLTLLLMQPAAQATVNTSNGNWTVSYDEIDPETIDGRFDFTRVYNNRDARDGWFGIGWGTSFEHTLTPMADGSVVIQAFGGGRLIWFGQPSDARVEAGVDRLMAEMQKAGAVPPGEAAATRKRLLGSLEQRVVATRKLPTPFSIPVGTDLPSGQRDSTLDPNAEKLLEVPEWLLQLFPEAHAMVNEIRKTLAACSRVKVTPAGFERLYCDKELELQTFRFDPQGQLTGYAWPDGYELRFQGHAARHRPASIVDTEGHALKLGWDAKGHLTELRWTNVEGKPERYVYKYNAAGDLVSERTTSGGGFDRTYDTRHNMTSISYIDGTKQLLSYDARDRLVKRVTRAGITQTFAYEGDPQGLRSVRVESPGRSALYRYNADNDLIQETQGDRLVMEKRFDARGRLVAIQRGSQVLTATYDDQGRRRTMSGLGRSFEMSYNAAGLLERLASLSTQDGQPLTSLALQYDSHGVVVGGDFQVRRSNIAAGSFRVLFDSQGQVSGVVDPADPSGAKLQLRMKWIKEFQESAQEFEEPFTTTSFRKVEAPK